MLYLAGQKGGCSKVVLGLQILGMTSEGLGEMFEGDFADACNKKHPSFAVCTHKEDNIKQLKT